MMDASSAIPAFIAKLWDMVSEKKYDSLIHWCKDGSSFVIKDPIKFCSELLPIYYKHNNMASFIRQLNKYGFKKVIALESASLKNDRADMQFSHPHFLKDYPELLIDIKRKISSNHKDVSTYPSLMIQIIKEVQLLQKKQNVFESKLQSMKNENSALWREHSLLRHKHQNLQKLLNKLIQFLFTLIQQTRGMNFHRVKRPLMIKDKPQYSNEKGLAAIKDHSHLRRQSVHGNSRLPSKSVNGGVTSNSSNHITEISEEPEIILPSILDEAGTSTMLSDLCEDSSPPDDQVLKNSTYDAKVYDLSPESEVFNPTSLVLAVPPHEISPAIVYGKPAGIQRKSDVSESLMDKRKSSDGMPGSSLKRPGEKASNSSRNLAKHPRMSVTKSQEIPIKKAHGLKTSITTENNTNFITSGAQSILKQDKTVPKKNIGGKTASSPGNDSSPIICSPSGSNYSPVPSVSDESAKKSSDPASEDDEGLEPLQKDIDSHIGAIQSDLDILKDLLQGEGISIDASTLLGLLNDDPLSLNMPEAVGLPSEPPSFGNELISYNAPSLFDIVDSLEEDDQPVFPTSDSLSSTLNTPRPEYSFELLNSNPTKGTNK